VGTPAESQDHTPFTPGTHTLGSLAAARILLGSLAAASNSLANLVASSALGSLAATGTPQGLRSTFGAAQAAQHNNYFHFNPRPIVTGSSIFQLLV